MDWTQQPLSGRVEGLFTTPNPDEFLTEPQNVMQFELSGIPGDRHSGFERVSGGREKKQYPKGTRIRNNRQWSAVSVAEMKAVADIMQLAEVKPEWIGANMLISGIEDFSHIPPMSILKFFKGDVEGPALVVYGQNKPCMHPHHAMEQALGEKLKIPFTKAAAECRGLVGWVEKAGVAHVGDRVEIWIP